jgi:tetratricopeptide (TPR) repeat protein
MRRVFCALVAAAALSIGLTAQIRPTSQEADRIQKETEQRAQKRAEELAFRSAVLLGTLNPDADRAIRRWAVAVRDWKKERNAGAAPLVAEGVLFDCLSRLHGIVTSQIATEKPVTYAADFAANRRGHAVKAFKAALDIERDLTEARFRHARLRAADDPRARQELETLSDGSFGVVSYLAAISRAEAARGLGDADGARRWYGRAAELRPRSAAPQIALASLGQPRSLPFDTFETSDPYYSYPCTVLTEPVGAELARRAAAVTIK